MSRNRVLAVGFNPEDVEYMSGLRADAEFLQAGSVSQVDEMLEQRSDPQIDLLLVSTKDQGQHEAVLECLKLRDHGALSDVPILAVISRYQMQVGRELKRIKQSDFLIQPVEEPQLSHKMRELGVT